MIRALVVAACLLHATTASADALGRLFFSAPERAALDAARNAALAPAFDISDRDAGKKAIPPEPVTPPPPISVEGIVTREHGPATLWLNGAPHESGDQSLQEMQLRVTPRAVEIAPAAGTAPVQVKPGQTFDPATGGVSETSIAPDQAP